MTTPAVAATVGRRFRPGPPAEGAPSEADLISRYTLDGGAVTDALGGVNGTITGTWASTAADSLVSGVSGQSFFKDGNGAYFTIPANNPLHNLGALSFSLYFQPTSDAAHSTICARANSTTIGGFSLERRTTGLLRGWHVGQDGGLRFFGGDPSGIAGTNLVVGTAYRITVTMGPAGLKIYLDDNLVDHIPQNINSWDNTAAWFFGIYTDAVSLPMQGVIDHIRVWTGEIQASAVAGLEDATSITPPAGAAGIASQFPGDVNISSHPSVLFHETFESGNISQWEAPPTIGSFTWAITTTAANVHSGTRALELTNAVRTDSGSQLVKMLSATQDVVFIRGYIKFDPAWDLGIATNNHIGISIRCGQFPAATRPTGTNWYTTTMQPTGGANDPGDIQHYTYHMDQATNFGDELNPNQGGNIQVNPGTWYSWETMLKANTPGVADGEIKAWIDGVLVTHIIGLRFRTVSTLKIDRVWIRNFIHNNSVRQNKIWYDDIVVATEYIGPQV